MEREATNRLLYLYLVYLIRHYLVGRDHPTQSVERASVSLVSHFYDRGRNLDECVDNMVIVVLFLNQPLKWIKQINISKNETPVSHYARQLCL